MASAASNRTWRRCSTGVEDDGGVGSGVDGAGAAEAPRSRGGHGDVRRGVLKTMATSASSGVSRCGVEERPR